MDQSEVFVGHESHFIHVYHQNGTWLRALPVDLTLGDVRAVAVCGETLVVAGENGCQALNRRDGRVIHVLCCMTTPTSHTGVVISDGEVFVANLARISVYSLADGRLLRTLSVNQSAPGDLAEVGTELFVLDGTHGRVYVLERTTGCVLRHFGNFNAPNNMVMHGDEILVSDYPNVQYVFSLTGQMVRSAHCCASRGLAVFGSELYALTDSNVIVME